STDSARRRISADGDPSTRAHDPTSGTATAGKDPRSSASCRARVVRSGTIAPASFSPLIGRNSSPSGSPGTTNRQFSGRASSRSDMASEDPAGLEVMPGVSEVKRGGEVDARLDAARRSGESEKASVHAIQAITHHGLREEGT